MSARRLENGDRQNGWRRKSSEQLTVSIEQARATGTGSKNSRSSVSSVKPIHSH